MITTVKMLSTDERNIQMKESFADVIYNLSPTDTPFSSMCKRESISAIEIGWFTDKLSDAAVKTGIAEGALAPAGTYEEIKRVMNLTQIFMKTVSVSNTSESVDFYGRKSEMAYQMTKKAQELKRDIEVTLCGKSRPSKGGFYSSLVLAPTGTPPSDGSVGGPSTNASDGIREFSNYKYQMINNPMGPGRTVVYGDTAGDGTGNAGTVTEDMLNKLMQKNWEYGGSAKTALVTPAMSNKIAHFALVGTGVGAGGRYRDSGQDKKLVNVVDVYVTPFGEMKIGLSRWLNYDELDTDFAGGTTGGLGSNAAKAYDNDIFLIDPKYIALAYLRQPNTKNMPIAGDSEQKLLTTELTFKLTAPDGCGLLTNVRVTDKT